MKGRVYDPTIGRFLQADVVVRAPPGQILSYNRYGYGWNNPKGYTDPSGYFRGCPADDGDIGASPVDDGTKDSSPNPASAKGDGNSNEGDANLNKEMGQEASGDGVVISPDAQKGVARDLLDRSMNTSGGVSITVDAPLSTVDKILSFFGAEEKGIPDAGLSLSLQIQPLTHPDGFDIGIVMTRRAVGGAGFMLKGSLGLEMNVGSIQGQAGNGWAGSIFVGEAGATWKFDDSGMITGGGFDFGLGIEASIAREASSTFTLRTGYTGSGCSMVVC